MDGQQDDNPVINRLVDDDETIDCETADVLAKIRSSGTHQLLIGVLASLCLNASQFFESNLKATAGLMNIDADVQQTLLCGWSLSHVGHPTQPFC